MRQNPEKSDFCEIWGVNFTNRGGIFQISLACLRRPFSATNSRIKQERPFVKTLKNPTFVKIAIF